LCSTLPLQYYISCVPPKQFCCWKSFTNTKLGSRNHSTNIYRVIGKQFKVTSKTSGMVFFDPRLIWASLTQMLSWVCRKPTGPIHVCCKTVAALMLVFKNESTIVRLFDQLVTSPHYYFRMWSSISETSVIPIPSPKESVSYRHCKVKSSFQHTLQYD
jgi:hypothetical protein